MTSLSRTYTRLVTLLGPDRVITDFEILEAYSRDETSDLASLPQIVVRAESVQEVSAILKICNEEKIPVVPRGAGSGVTGGAVPVQGGLVLSLERMNRIIEIDGRNMVAVVEPGAITGEIQKAALEAGLMYPPDPASLDMCSIGGNVAEIAGGPRAVKYGTTRDYVLGLEFVLADGSVIATGGKFVKNATGYNLTGILLGSEGTLAVITKIILKLIPAPLHVIDLLVPFDSLQGAIEAVYAITMSRTVPAAMEFMEEDAIALVSRFHGGDVPFPRARAHLLIQLDGPSHDALHRDIELVSAALGSAAAQAITAAAGPQRERLWKARRAIREAIHACSPVFLAEDCVVPRSNIPSFLLGLKDHLSQRNLKSIMFGHAGDGNVHIDVLKEDMDYGRWKEMLPELKKEIYRRALAEGGTISGEHGIGSLRKDYLRMALGEAEIALMKRIKKAFDPRGIINPGKVIP